MEANGGAAKPARGTARLGAEDHSVLVADGEGAAAAGSAVGMGLRLRSAFSRPAPLRFPPPIPSLCACWILGEGVEVRGGWSGP